MRDKKSTKREKLFFLSILFFAVCSIAYSLDLSLSKKDILVIQDPVGGYHLYIAKKSDIGSVLLTETTKDLNKELHNFAYRDPDFNEINGNEIRLLDGKILSPEKKLYSLIDSTPEKNTPIGEAFHIWIPYTIVYGYPWSRSGEVEVMDGTFLNIRTFEKPHADYAGAFTDNPFILRLTQIAIKEDTKAPNKSDTKDLAKFSKPAIDAFDDIAHATGGNLIYAKRGADLVPLIKGLLVPTDKRKLEVVFVIDATASMYDDIKEVRKALKEVLVAQLPLYDDFKIGLVLYKDYRDEFLVKTACLFTKDIEKFNKALHSFRVAGGGDIPEAVYEGLDAALQFKWTSTDEGLERKIILIGDAPPHKKPRGKITKDDVYSLASEKKVLMYPIILPHANSY